MSKKKRMKRIGKKLVLRWQHMQIAPAFSCWVGNVEESKRLRRVSNKVLLRWRSMSLGPAFERWWEWCEDLKETRQRTEAVLKRWRCMSMAPAFSAWAEHVDELIMQRQNDEDGLGVSTESDSNTAAMDSRIAQMEEMIDMQRVLHKNATLQVESERKQIHRELCGREEVLRGVCADLKLLAGHYQDNNLQAAGGKQQTQTSPDEHLAQMEHTSAMALQSLEQRYAEIAQEHEALVQVYKTQEAEQRQLLDELEIISSANAHFYTATHASVGRLEGEMKELQDATSKLQEKLQSSQKEVGRLTQVQRERQASIRSLEKDIEDRDKRIALFEEEEVSRLTEGRRETEESIQSMQKAVGERDKNIASLEKKIVSLEQGLLEAKEALQSSQQEVGRLTEVRRGRKASIQWWCRLALLSI